MKIIVFGANGVTGRVLTQQALDAGHEVTAVTRQPSSFPIADGRLTVVGADVLDASAVDAAIAEAGADVVLSTLGVPFTRQPITVYSVGAANMVAAMSRHGVKRVVLVSSSAAEPHHHAEGGFVMNRILQPMVTATIGKTTYRDMRAMESLVRASDLEWTIMRPSGLFDAEAVSGYELFDNEAPGIFTSRADLAASMLQVAFDPSRVGKAVAVTTSEGAPTLVQMIRREAFK
jgi:nucleoside-diphosphate-sugar epimerase